MHTIHLSDEDFDTLLLCLGYAAGAANKDDNRPMFLSFLRLANAINENNPNWTPYQFEDEAAMQSRVVSGDETEESTGLSGSGGNK